MADKKEYAIKKIKLLDTSLEQKEAVLNEIRLLASLKQPNIIEYKEAFIDEPSFSLWYLYSIFIVIR